MVIAVIPVGDSKRLKGKHFLELGNKRIIEIIVERLFQSNLFENIIIYSVFYTEVKNATLVIDEEKKGAMNVLIKSLKKFNTNIFLIAGDLPFFSIESIKKMFVYPEQLSVIPKWSNGYLEPMHAIYSISALEYPEKRSFHKFIEQIPKIFMSAENFPRYEFFNMNTQEDYSKAKEIYQLSIIRNYEI